MSWVLKSVWVLAAATATAAITMPHAPDLLLYNHSPSIPVGLYARINPRPNLDIGSIVTVRA
jgi:type IV secretory pathway protease TraF